MARGGLRRRRGERRAEYAVVAGIYVVTRLIILAALALFAAMNSTSLGQALTSWDAQWMVDIAEHGYFGVGDVEGPSGSEPGHWQSLAFFPAFPHLLGALSWIPGVDPAVAGSVVAALSGLVLAFAVTELARMIGAGPRGRIVAVVLVTCAPMSVVFLMPYTDGPFLALAAWSLVFMIRKRWLPAGVLVFIAGLTRPTAAALFVALGVTALVRDRRNWRAWVAVVLAPLGWIGFLLWASAHLWKIGGWFGAQSRGWNTGLDGGLATVRFIGHALVTSRETGYAVSAVIILAVTVTLVVATLPPLLRLWGTAWPVLLYSWVVAAQILLSDGLMHSRPRLLLAASLVLVVFGLMVREKPSADTPDTSGGAAGWMPREVAVGMLVLWFFAGTWAGCYLLTAFPWAI